MKSHKKVKRPQVSLESCTSALEALERAKKAEDIEQNVDFLIEHIFIIKANVACPFDRQFFIDAAKARKDSVKSTSKEQDQGKELRHLCLNFIRVITALALNEKYMRQLIPRLIAIIRLEASLIKVLKSECKSDSTVYPSFPASVLELLIGIVLYTEGYDEDVLDDLLSQYLLSSAEWTYNSYVVLDQIKKNFDTSTNAVYVNKKLPDYVFLQRFISMLFRMPPPPQKTGSGQAAILKSTAKQGLMEEDLDSGSDIEYDEETGDETSDSDGESAYSDDQTEFFVDDERNSCSYARLYSTVWHNTVFGRIPLTGEPLYKVLNHMPDNILPYSSNPTAYVNWLMNHLNGKEPILSVLSLRSIFVLIVKHRLGEVDGLRAKNAETQPISAFYDRLYEHLTEYLIASKFGSGLLQLLCASLQSTMLPSLLVARFIKKLVRTACFTRSAESTILLTIAINLLKRHNQTCLKMVHMDHVEGEKQGISDGDYCIPARTDVDFAGDENKRLFLWELELLINHFNERTAKVASTFYSHLRKKRCMLLKAEDIIGCDAREHLRQELTKAKREDNNTFRKTLQTTTDLAKQIIL